MSASPNRRMKRHVQQAIRRDVKKRTRNVAKLDRWIREHPSNPLAIKLRAMKAGLQVVTAEEMTKATGQRVIEKIHGERLTPSGLVIPPGAKVNVGTTRKGRET